MRAEAEALPPGLGDNQGIGGAFNGAGHVGADDAGDPARLEKGRPCREAAAGGDVHDGPGAAGRCAGAAAGAGSEEFQLRQ